MRVQVLGLRVEGAQGSAFRVQGSKLRVQGSKVWVRGSVFRVQFLGFRVQGSGFRIQSSRVWVQVSGLANARTHATCASYERPTPLHPKGLWGVGFVLCLFLLLATGAGCRGQSTGAGCRVRALCLFLLLEGVVCSRGGCFLSKQPSLESVLTPRSFLHPRSVQRA
ncbi:hypothetical protein T484DRAFT_3139111 [Baffinella frigidus]|nr:hypothetical protein T484DRAFT_3139111 [Cryptophyta sp. CCMP2293]